MAHQKKAKTPESLSNKGTIFSVGVVGAVIFLTYVLFFWLYMSRIGG
ncbi:hypothetical protein [Pseudalkalibacillus caeni]|nr:hypothetical protein [Pseudalkalibacillus caeni]